MPGANGWYGTVAATGQPGGLFYPGDSIDLDVQLNGVKADEAFTVEITPIDQPFVMPDGNDLLWLGNYGVSPRGKPVVATAAFANPEDAAKGLLKLRGLPLERFGTAAVALVVAGRGKQPLGTVARGLVPRRGDRWKNQATFHLGGGAFAGSWETQAAIVARIGYRWVRPDNFPNWQGSDGGQGKPFNFEKQDAMMAVFQQHGLYMISNAYGSPGWAMDQQNVKAYFFAHGPELDGELEKWGEEAAKRWCGADGEGPLQGIDYWNEPWEGGGISAWRGDAIRYRQLYTALCKGMKRGAPRILMGGCSSIMNTGDKFFTTAALEKEFTPMVDLLTDHYVGPAMCYGPRIAQRMAAETGRPIISMESETWFGGNARYQAATLAFFLATGQRIVNTNHPAQLLWLNGSTGQPMPKPSLSAMNAFCHFAGDRLFERVVFHDHLPWLFQFGTGADSAFVLLGDGSHIVHDQYDQIRADGSIAIPVSTGVVVHDVYGNVLPAVDGVVTVPLNRDSFWLTPAPGQTADTVVAAVRAARIAKVKPVDVVLRDLTALPAAGGAVEVELRNVLNRPVAGRVELKLGGGIVLRETAQDVRLAPGERHFVSFPIASATPEPGNAYPAEAVFTGADGEAKRAETISANVIVRGSPTIDGDLADWADAPPVRAQAGGYVNDPTLKLWKPWETFTEQKGGVAEFRVKRDDRFLYVAIRERNATWAPKPRLSTRDDDQFFGTTPATANTYWSPTFGTPDPGDQSLPYYGNLAQIAIGLGLGSEAHRLPAPERTPETILAMPDTDYEYAVWGATDGGSEVWRNYAAGWNWTRHFAPRTIPKGGYDGVPAGFQAVVRKDGDDVVYEVALPLADMPLCRPEMLEAGKTICLTFKLPASNVKFGEGKSATRPNGMSTLPRWEVSPSNSIRWGLAK